MATRGQKKSKELNRSIDVSDCELRLLIAMAPGRNDGGGVDVVVGGRAGAVVLQLQPGRFHGRRRRLQVGHLALEHGAVGREGGGRDVEVEGDAEEEVHLQVVHLHQADAAHAREVGVVVTSEQSGSKFDQITELKFDQKTELLFTELLQCAN